ncbi:MAG TPA: prolyl oligopeptidase family serine peptidase [Chitinophagaceae bacterium]|nr:prolyl oligopeptidase family serine peptidase [Chitinophagaceae bacterium]
MKKQVLLAKLLLFSVFAFAQKKPLDHSVYDSWQRIGERLISNDGKWVVYTIDPQEGDNELVIQSSDGKYKKSLERGYNAVITEDSRFAIFRIKPFFKDTREAKIKKKRPDDMPKDSFAIVELGKDSVWKVARVKGFKVPEKEAGWVAYHLEKSVEKKEPEKKKTELPDKKIADSLNKVIDSLQQVIQAMPMKKKKKQKDEDFATGDIDYPLLTFDGEDAEGDEPAAGSADAGTDLVVRNLLNGQEKVFNNVLEYYFSKTGGKLLMEQAKNPKDSLSKLSVILYDLNEAKATVLSKGGNDFKSFSFSEDGSQVAYVAERDARPKELQKFYRVWYYKNGMDSATLLADKNSVGMKLGMTISEYGNLSFSKSGKRLFFGTAPIQPPKDTSLVEMDQVKLDIWHYNDDYLQTVQLFRLQRDLQTNYLAVYHLDKGELKQLGSVELPTVYPTNEGDGDQFVGVTDYGKRIESQWTGTTKKDIYAVNVNDGSRQLVKKDLEGIMSPQYISPSGKYILWYDSKARHYFVWDGTAARNISQKIKYPLWNEEHDTPNDPPPYGVMGWQEGDSAVYVYDRYDVWKCSMQSVADPLNITLIGRSGKERIRHIQTDPEARFLKPGETIYYKLTNEANKSEELIESTLKSWLSYEQVEGGAYTFGQIKKAKDSPSLIFTHESYVNSPDLYIDNLKPNKPEKAIQLSSINPQQKDYNWGSAELYKWKAFNGKMSEGVLYKPEDFDPSKKYPLILYFYETHSNDLHDYIPPTPTGSRLNISFFVSRGYVVFSPDIRYTTGHPAKNCFDYVVSAAQDLAKQKWIDAKNIGIQGQSWGGIQVAQLVTMTNMFKAAWAGAPVANMTSAYGGIRWESGVNRQFQYEKTQSRIGATLWEKPNLYIENSPLFHLPKVKTPLVIMANDADGAVPWYQGIELFTAMRRLGKQVWMLNYNGEAHNLRERKNQKDISIREQQYFDWLLKGAKPPKWITEGVPAIKKGKDWGLELVN